MAVPTGTLQAHSAVGNREDLEDMIYMISPTETPFLSMAKRTTASNPTHEWQTDVLATASTANAQIEGDDASNGTSVPTNRIKNFCQISSKYAIVSGTQNAANAAGRNREMAYQLMKRSQELKRDMETILTQNHGSSAGGAATARQLAGLEAWLSTNVTSCSSSAGTNAGYATATGLVAAPADGSPVGSFDKEDLHAVIRACWTQGGSPTVVMVGPVNKVRISQSFTGIATLYREASATANGTRIIGAADVYVSDFGEHRIVPNRFVRDRTITVLDMDYWSVAYYRKLQQFEIARTGDAEKRLILSEYTLVSRNEAASGKITDATT